MKKLFSLFITGFLVLSAIACGEGSSDRDDKPKPTGGQEDPVYQDAGKTDFAYETVYSIDKLKMKIKTNKAGDIKNIQYKIIPKENYTKKSMLSKTSATTEYETDLVELNIVSNSDVDEVATVTIEHSGPTINYQELFDADDSNDNVFQDRYMLVMEKNSKWIPLYYIVYNHEKNSFEAMIKINKDTQNTKIALIKESNYIVNNGTYSYKDIMKFWSSYVDNNTANARLTSVNLYDLKKPVIFKERLNPYENTTADIYFNNDTISYYKYDKLHTLKVKDFNAGTGNYDAEITFLVDGKDEVKYFESPQMQCQITLENCVGINGILRIVKDSGVLIEYDLNDNTKYTVDGTNKIFSFNDLQEAALAYEIIAEGYYRHIGPFRPWPRINNRGTHVSVELKATEDNSFINETGEYIFANNDSTTDAQDGTAGPGYYNYPSRTVMKQQSFDIESFKIKETPNSYQFEITLTKELSYEWTTGFDIYLQMKHVAPETPAHTRALYGRNVDFEENDGWDKVIPVFGGMTRGTVDYFAKGQNPEYAADIIVPFIKNYQGKTVVVAIKKGQISIDLKTELNAIQVFTMGIEEPQHADFHTTMNRMVEPAHYTASNPWEAGNENFSVSFNNSALNEWQFSINYDKLFELYPNFLKDNLEEYILDPIDFNKWFSLADNHYQLAYHTTNDGGGTYESNKDTLWYVSAEDSYGEQWFRIIPFVIDIMNGTAIDDSPVANIDLDSFTINNYAKIKMVKAVPVE